jgi:hypothetical protein
MADGLTLLGLGRLEDALPDGPDDHEGQPERREREQDHARTVAR